MGTHVACLPRINITQTTDTIVGLATLAPLICGVLLGTHVTLI